MNSVRWKNLSLKYQRFTPSGGKNVGIRKSEFVTKTQFLSGNFSYWTRHKKLLILFYLPLQHLNTTLQYFNTSALQHFNTSTQHFNTSTLQYFNTSALQHFNTSTQHFNTSILQHFNNAKLKNFRTLNLLLTPSINAKTFKNCYINFKERKNGRINICLVTIQIQDYTWIFKSMSALHKLVLGLGSD